LISETMTLIIADQQRILTPLSGEDRTRSWLDVFCALEYHYEYAPIFIVVGAVDRKEPHGCQVIRKEHL
jgi:hypothetical protein